MGKSLAERFCELFRGLDRVHGTTNTARLKLNQDKGKMEGSSFVVKQPPSVSLWESHLAGTYGLGIFPLRDDGTCYWGAIDIDIYDLDHKSLGQQVQQLNLPLVIARTKSGGAHLFLFMIEATSAKLVRGKLMDWAVILGYSGVEVFPKQVSLASENDFGNWLNMPYHGGSKTTRYAIRNGQAIADPVAFIDYAEKIRLSVGKLQNIRVQHEEAFEGGPPCLQALSQRGFPEGNRNKALFNCAIYLKKRYGEEDWKPYLDKINSRFIQPPLGHQEVSKVSRSAEAKKYTYSCNEDPIRSVCNRQICLTREFGIRGGSDQLNVSINGLIRLMTEPPTWIVDVNGARIEVDGATLLNQRAFRAIVFDRIKMLPNMVKQGAWDKIINERAQVAEDVEAPVTASPEGELVSHLEDFCTDSHAMEREEILNGLPWDDAETKLTYFRSSDFKSYLEVKRIRGWPNSKLWAALRRHGAKHKSMRIKNKVIQVWGVPSFSQQDEPFKVPAVVDEGEF